MIKQTTPFPLDVLVLYNSTAGVRRGTPTDDLPDMDEVAVGPILAALEELGHAPRALGITYDNLTLLEEIEAEFVLNLCEGNGLDGHPGLEVLAPLVRRGLRFSRPVLLRAEQRKVAGAPRCTRSGLSLLTRP